MPSWGIQAAFSRNWKPPCVTTKRVQRGRETARSRSDTASATLRAARGADRGKSRSSAAPAVGRKTTTESRCSRSRASTLDRPHDEEQQCDQAEEESQRVVPDVARLEEPQE